MFSKFQETLTNKERIAKRWEYLVVLDKGDEIIASLKHLISERNVNGFFIGIGAVRDPIIAYFDTKQKKYIEKKFEGEFEIVSLIGNLGTDENGEPIVHAHITIADENYNVHGGHLVQGYVSVTLELIVIRVDSIKRSVDNKWGLKLISGAF